MALLISETLGQSTYFHSDTQETYRDFLFTDKNEEDCPVNNKPIACPFCKTTIGFLSGEDGAEITVVCSECGSHYTVDLQTQQIIRKQ